MFFFLISGIFIFVIGSNGISAFKILFNEVPVFLKLSILAMFGFIFYAREQEKSKHKEWWSKASVKEKKEYLDKIRKGLK